MDKIRSPLAKILVHSEGLGAPNAEMVRMRAEELALIAGRKEYTDEDWQRARAELHGLPPDVAGDEMASEFMVSEADMVAVDVGHHVQRVPLDDERNLVDELYQEGLQEAEHERMVQACREQAAEETEEDEEEE